MYGLWKIISEAITIGTTYENSYRRETVSILTALVFFDFYFVIRLQSNDSQNIIYIAFQIYMRNMLQSLQPEKCFKETHPETQWRTTFRLSILCLRVQPEG